MNRGTTPTHTFTIPFDAGFVENVRVLYAQKDKVVFCKEGKACNLEGNTVRVDLTQEETFLFSCQDLVQIQIRVKTHDSKVHLSDIMLVPVGKCLESEVF